MNVCLVTSPSSRVPLLPHCVYSFICSYSDGDLTLIYPDGGMCSSGFQRMTIINFECNKTACKISLRTLFPFSFLWHHAVVVSRITVFANCEFNPDLLVLASFLQPTVGEGHQFLPGRQTALITLTGRQLLHVSKRRRTCCVKSEMARSTMTFHPSHDSLVSLLDVSRFLFLFWSCLI